LFKIKGLAFVTVCSGFAGKSIKKVVDIQGKQEYNS
jgi:hypothetical protein